jgi:steroid 5-alpha reductase family enzyme
VFDLNVYADGLAVGLGIGILAWLASIPRRDVSLVDSLWSLLFLAMAATYVALAPAVNERAYLLLFMVTVWAVRLSLFITLRNWGEPEDRRYQAIRADNEPGFWRKSLYLVFGQQAILAWIISLPLLGATLGGRPLGMLDFAAVALWLVGFGFEAIGDQQLARFKADPANRGKVLDRGLWRYTRHPNYFGEACIWWAYYLFAASAGAWWTVVGPILMTFLLLRVSGVRLLETDIGERRPAYRDYIRRTNAFIPGAPTRPAAD